MKIKEFKDLGIFIQDDNNPRGQEIIENLYEFSKEYKVNRYIAFKPMFYDLFAKYDENDLFHTTYSSEGIFGETNVEVIITYKEEYSERPKKPSQSKDLIKYTVIINSDMENQCQREGKSIFNFENKNSLKEFLLNDIDINFIDEVREFANNL